jgi:hypothetical protein
MFYSAGSQTCNSSIQTPKMPPFSDYSNDLNVSSHSLDGVNKDQLFEDQPRRRARSPRSVRFTENHEVFEIPHASDLSKDEINQVWMSDVELSAIRRHCANVVMFMDEKMAAQHGICFRGLEQNCPQYVAHKCSILRKIYDAVDAIQEFQATTGMEAPDLLAESLKLMSSHSAAAAYVTAMNDAAEVYGNKITP